MGYTLLENHTNLVINCMWFNEAKAFVFTDYIFVAQKESVLCHKKQISPEIQIIVIVTIFSLLSFSSNCFIHFALIYILLKSLSTYEKTAIRP